MKKLESIGYSELNLQDQTTKIIVNENFKEKLAELSGYSKIVIVHYFNDAEEKILKEVFGEDVKNHTVSMEDIKLISIIDNIITVEGTIGKFNEIIDIQPYYPEYDLQIGDENPEWIKFIFDEIEKKHCE